MASQTCVICDDPLILELGADSDSENGLDGSSQQTLESVPDDVELSCGCHFHWECYIESYTVTECPNCSKDVSSLSPTNEQQVLCIVRNEGGVQHDFDILPLASEEAYLKTYPEERKGRALLEFCKEGDVDAIVHLLRDDSDVSEGDVDLDVLRYQGSFKDVEGSGLHVAITYNQVEVAWLLLIVGSQLDWSAFPGYILQAASSLGVGKEDRRAGPDIRSLKNEAGQTAADVAQAAGGVWDDWNKSGRLNV